MVQPCRLEPLESRVLLDGGMAAHVFARLEGTIEQPGGTAEMRITLNDELFRFQRPKMVLGFKLSSSDPSHFDADSLSMTDRRGRTKRGLVRVPANSVVGRYDLRRGVYDVQVHSADASTGDFQLEIYLVGDVDGDRKVTLLDAKLAAGAFGAKAGDDRYVLEADGNLDGRITGRDIHMLWRNYVNAAHVNPLELAVSAAAADMGAGGSISAWTPGGHGGGGSVAFGVAGATQAGATVRLDVDGDGFDDGEMVAADDGQYSFTQWLSPGEHMLGVEATDLFGQRRVEQVSVVVEAAAVGPVISGLVNDSGVSDQDGVTNDATPGLFGMASPGAAVTVSEAVLGVLGVVAADAGGQWVFDDAQVKLADGDYVFSASTFDDTGQLQVSAPFAVTIDTAAPTPPSLDLHGDFLTGRLGSYQTTFGVVTLIGSTSPGSIVELIGDDFVTSLAVTTADEDGHFVFEQVSLNVGFNGFLLIGSDLAGNQAFSLGSIERVAA